MQSDMVKWRNLRRLLEAMSYDIVAMEKYWKLDNAEADVAESWPIGLSQGLQSFLLSDL